MGRSRVFCEISPDTKRVIRILKNYGEACFLPPERLIELPRSEAVKSIRQQVFERDNYQCRDCGKLLSFQTGHMDEIKPRGKGGEIGLDNCQLLCAECHISPRGKHGDRFPKWSRRA